MCKERYTTMISSLTLNKGPKALGIIINVSRHNAVNIGLIAMSSYIYILGVFLNLLGPKLFVGQTHVFC